MFHSTAFDPSTKLPAAAEATFAGSSIRRAHSIRNKERCVSVAADGLAFRMLVAFRVHPHIGNVLTHISGGDWRKIERALGTLFDPSTVNRAHTALEANLLDLMCAERGVTGRIMKPYLHDVLPRS